MYKEYSRVAMAKLLNTLIRLNIEPGPREMGNRQKRAFDLAYKMHDKYFERRYNKNKVSREEAVTQE